MTIRVAIDIDDTCFEFIGTAVQIANDRFGFDINPDDITTWDLRESLPDHVAQAVCEAMPSVYSHPSLRVLPGALPGVLGIRSVAEIIFVTAGGFSILEKQSAMWRHGFLQSDPGRISISDEMIVAKRKEWVDADILFDDNVDNVRTWIDSGVHRRAFLMRRPWNWNYGPTYTWDSLMDADVECGRVVPRNLLNNA